MLPTFAWSANDTMRIAFFAASRAGPRCHHRPCPAAGDALRCHRRAACREQAAFLKSDPRLWRRL